MCIRRLATCILSYGWVCEALYTTTRSKYRAKSSGDIGHPYFTPIVVRKGVLPPGTIPLVFTNTLRMVSKILQSRP